MRRLTVDDEDDRLGLGIVLGLRDISTKAANGFHVPHGFALVDLTAEAALAHSNVGRHRWSFGSLLACLLLEVNRRIPEAEDNGIFSPPRFIHSVNQTMRIRIWPHHRLIVSIHSRVIWVDPKRPENIWSEREMTRSRSCCIIRLPL